MHTQESAWVRPRNFNDVVKPNGKPRQHTDILLILGKHPGVSTTVRFTNVYSLGINNFVMSARYGGQKETVFDGDEDAGYEYLYGRQLKHSTSNNHTPAATSRHFRCLQERESTIKRRLQRHLDVSSNAIHLLYSITFELYD